MVDPGVWLRRDTAARKHTCTPPTDAGGPGDVWRCACGRRYTCVSTCTYTPALVTMEPTWVRRWWPWPR